MPITCCSITIHFLFLAVIVNVFCTPLKTDMTQIAKDTDLSDSTVQIAHDSSLGQTEPWWSRLRTTNLTFSYYRTSNSVRLRTLL
ncbi:hypothetical protein BD560DRAFT_397305 [Blakeslea trispora]|nr:hypothetical protein BD560DRAFT_397305 [Blakeslea trispora]